MSKMIFINLPVTDLARATAFYEALGATKNPKFSNEMASMVSFSDAINVMLLTHEFFGTFTSKPIADARRSCQVLLCLSAESPEAVDALTDKATAAGGQPDVTPKQDFGGMMYGRSFEDLDGHIWEVMWMNPAAAEQGASAFEPTPA
jgi:predicted lactoylglutathione lyase